MKTKHTFKAILATLAVIVATPSFAAIGWLNNNDGKNEIHVSLTQGAASFGSGLTVIEASAGYMRRIYPQFSVGADVSIVSFSYEDYSGTSTAIYGLGHYAINGNNFGESFYALAGVGVGSAVSKYASTVDSHNGIGFRLGGGKRTTIAKQLIWKPELYFEKVSEMDGVVVLKFLDLSYVF